MRVFVNSEMMNDRFGHRKLALERVLLGLRRHTSIEVKVEDNYKGSELHLSWGHKGGANNLVLESGFINNYEADSYSESRNYFTSTVWRGNCNHGEWNFGNRPNDRVLKHNISLYPWKQHEEKALIFYQCSGDKAVAAAPGGYSSFMRGLANESVRSFKEVMLRPHPQQPERAGRRKILKGSLRQALEWADVGISFSSTAAIDCVLNGVPAITFGSFSMAWDVTSHSLDKVIRPDREQWLNNLMYAQWTHAELESGDFWEQVREGYRP
jgi:hypothetical protein